MGKHTRRARHGRVAAVGGVLIVLVGIAVVLAPPAHAAGPVVVVTHTTDDQQPGSLRAVITEANEHQGLDTTIQLPAGHYVLDRCGPTTDDWDNAWGDLDIASYAGIARIVGLGSGATIEQTCVDERVLDVHSYGQFTLDNLTITGGQGRGRGGGVAANETVVIVRSHFLGNTARGKPGREPTQGEPYASSGGAGIGGAVAAGIVAVASSTFEGNVAIGGPAWIGGGSGGGARGGAIATGGFSTTTSVFRDNAARGVPRTNFGADGTAFGGAVDGNKVVATNVTFDHNEANASNGSGETGQGGAVHAYSDVTFTDVTATGNKAVGDAERSGDAVNAGGAVSGEATITITRGLFTGNTASARGGVARGPSVIIDRAHLHDNAAGSEGGAVMAYIANVTAATVSANHAPRGGAVATPSFGSVTVENSTIVGNSAGAANGSPKPGAAFATKVLELEATTMVGNTGTTAIEAPTVQVRQSVLGQQSGGSLCSEATTSGSGGWNVADDSSCGLGDPTDRQGPRSLSLGPLQDNGGPTPTRAPLTGSPLADAIPMATCSTPTDQRGVTRPQGSRCDVGAVETAGGVAVHGYFHPMAPARILDSRSPTGGWNAPLVAGTPKALVVAGPATGIPTQADAVVLNVTVTGATDNSFVTAYPAGTAAPASSNLNFAAGETTANAVTVKVGNDDQIMFANAIGATHVVVDVVGYFSGAVRDRFTAVTPSRLLDSRTGTGFAGPVVAGAPRSLQVGAATGPVPTTASAVVVNVTVTEGTVNSFLTVHPGSGPTPNASTLNFGPGQTKANLATVALSPAGTIAFTNAVGAVAVVADLVGYFDPTQGDVFHAVDPVRLLDSRSAVGGWSGPLVAGSARQLTMAGGALPPAATAVVGNVTVTGSTAASYLTVEPAGVPPTATSTVNFAAGQTLPNLAVTKVGAGGVLTFRTQTGSTHVVYDVAGWYEPT